MNAMLHNGKFQANQSKPLEQQVLEAPETLSSSADMSEPTNSQKDSSFLNSRRSASNQS